MGTEDVLCQVGGRTLFVGYIVRIDYCGPVPKNLRHIPRIVWVVYHYPL